ncbi:MAG TPA: nuclear transport factor 2 family protein [Pyrinomonadaceae bacterium]|jgi:ketosteroid isomerase-like protein
MNEEIAAGIVTDDSVKQEILNLAEQWAQALVSNDAQKIGSFMSDDWVIVGQSGITRKQDFLPFIESGDLTHETMELIGEARVQIYGDTALLSGRVTNNGHYKGAPFSADEWTTDVFMRREGRWLCVLSHITPI